MRIISIVLFFLVFAFADLKVYSKAAKDVNGTIYLTKPYLIYNNELFIEANKGILKKNKQIFLEGNVTIIYKNEVILSNKVEVFSKDNIKLYNSFVYDKNLEVWFKNKVSTIKNNKIIFFEDSIFSSCCVNDPDWYIFATRGNFNKETKYLKAYNLTLYIHDTPVFYLPFFFSSFDKRRRSGLLRPYFGYSPQEGFLYSQPIYFVTSIRNDLEITPTIRTKRGRGVYAEFRFVDSPYSFGSIKGGIFIDKYQYYILNNLAYRKHFGYEIKYKRDKVFEKDKLYVDIKYANDVNYFYLDPRNYTFDQRYLVDKIITSKINYIRSFDDSILGIYNKYFIDTSLLTNKNTIQILPQINYHLFEKKRFNLLTSFDYNYYNYYSVTKRYFVNTFLLPVGLNFNYKLFNLKVSEVLRGEYGNFYGSNLPASYYLDTYTQIKLSSSFTKNDKFLHIISPSVTLNIKNYNKARITSDIINNIQMRNSVSLDLFEIFEKDDFYLDHKFHQFITLKDLTYEDMENKINLSYRNFSLNENNKYSWKINKVVYNAIGVSYKFDRYKVSLTHVYQYDPRLKSIDFKIQKNITQYKNLYFEYNYDLLNKYPKFWLFGIKLNKKCWQYNISLKKSLTPILKDDGVSYKVNYTFGITVNFYPIGGVKQYLFFE